jgi:hypothetical protein
MNPKIALPLILASLFGACSDSPSDKVAGGGFETSDIQVAVTDSSGRTIVGARVWLVANRADSIQSPQVIDSATTDSQGRAALNASGDTQVSFSMEAWVDDTLVGFAPRIAAGLTRPLPLNMRRPRLLTLPCAFDPFMVILPGSHFKQFQPPACKDSFFVLLPPGAWELLKVNLFGPPKTTSFVVHTDSLPVWNPPPRTDGGPFKPGPYPPPYQPTKR